jgi:hypothetical protein
VRQSRFLVVDRRVVPVAAVAVAEAVYLDSADAVTNLELLAVWPCGKDDPGVFAACDKGLARGRPASVKVPSSTAGVLADCDVVDVDGAGLDFDEHLALFRSRRGWNLPKGERVRDGANGTPLVQVCGLHHAVRLMEIRKISLLFFSARIPAQNPPQK